MNSYQTEERENRREQIVLMQLLISSSPEAVDAADHFIKTAAGGFDAPEQLLEPIRTYMLRAVEALDGDVLPTLQIKADLVLAALLMDLYEELDAQRGAGGADG